MSAVVFSVFACSILVVLKNPKKRASTVKCLLSPAYAAEEWFYQRKIGRHEERGPMMDKVDFMGRFPERACLFSSIEEIYAVKTIKHPRYDEIMEEQKSLSWPKYVYGKVVVVEKSGLAHVLRTEPAKEGIRFFAMVPTDVKAGDFVSFTIKSANDQPVFDSVMSERVKQ